MLSLEKLQRLIAFPSITPDSAESLDFIKEQLTELGFKVSCKRHTDTDNFYARLNDVNPNFCFAGHVDVVPPGPVSSWTSDPFHPMIQDQKIFGRGAVDMKGGIAAFLAATERFVKTQEKIFISISYLLTSDEEGPAHHGTKVMLQELASAKEDITFCLVGEPTSLNTIGDVVKNGRRGSLNAKLTIKGVQGHAAYPHLAVNPNHLMISVLSHLVSSIPDEGYLWENVRFDPTAIQVTSIDCANLTTNVIPGQTTAMFNIRFSPGYSSDALIHKIHEIIRQHHNDYDLQTHVSGEPFYCQSPFLENLVSQSIQKVTGKKPSLSTSGGTSDARFIKDYCPVIELGLLNKTAHQIDEHTTISDLECLENIYYQILVDLNSHVKDQGLNSFS